MKGNLAKLLQLKGLYFDWKQDEFTLRTHPNLKGRSIGFIAQDIEEVIPEIVIDDSEGIKSVQYGLITAVALGALQEQMTRIKFMRKRINTLKNSIVENG